MTTKLPAVGPISIRDFNLGMEGTLGFSAGRATGLNDPAVRATINKRTGPVSMSDLLDKWVSRMSKPIASVSAILTLATGSKASGIYKVKLTIENSGAIDFAGYDSSGVRTTTYQTNFIPGAVGLNAWWQCYITITRTTWNSQGVVSASTSYLSDSPNWGNIIIECDGTAGGLPDATYQIDLVDRFDASNTFSFTTRLQVTA